MKKKEETIFKNTVGRPTNEIKKKRRVFGFSIVFLIMAVVMTGVLSVSNINYIKEGNLKAAATNHEINMKKFDSGTLPIGKTTKKFKVTLSDITDNVVVFSSNRSIIEVVKYGDYSATGNSWALKVKKPGIVTIAAQAVGIVNGKQKVYRTLQYTYVVKEHALSMEKLDKNNLIIGKETKNFKINVSSTGDSVALTSNMPSVVSVVKYGDNSYKGNLWALKVKKAGTVTITAQAYKMVNGKKKVYNTLKYVYTISSLSTSQLYCVSDDNKTKLISEIEVNKPFTCYTKNTAGIKLSAPKTGLESGYNNKMTTTKGNYGINLMYTKAGTKNISAESTKGKIGSAASIKIKVKNVSSVSNTLKLYCVADKGDSETNKITKVGLNKEFYCYANNKNGIQIEADETGLANGYESRYTTVKDDYWIRLKYTSSGSKTITAKSGNDIAKVSINVSDDSSNVTKTTTKTTTKSSRNSKIISNIITVNQYSVNESYKGEKYPNGCEPISLYILLKYYGVNVTAADVMNAVLQCGTPVAGRTGPDPDECFLGNPEYPNSWGIYPGGLEKTVENEENEKNKNLKDKIRKAGLGNIINGTGMDFSKIYELIDSDRPVVVWTFDWTSTRKGFTWDNKGNISGYTTKTWKSKNGTVTWISPNHAVVVIGYDNDNIIISDPIDGKIKGIPKKTFEKAYNIKGKKALYY